MQRDEISETKQKQSKCTWIYGFWGPLILRKTLDGGGEFDRISRVLTMGGQKSQKNQPFVIIEYSLIG